MGESSFWYRPTRVVPDQRPLNGRRSCVVSAIVSNIASVKLHLKITDTSILFDSFVNRYLKHLYYERNLQWHQLCLMKVCTSLHTDNHASTSPLSFLQAGCSSCHPTNSIKALKASASVLSNTVEPRYIELG